MSKKNQYPVQKFTGIPVEPDAGGKYQLKVDQHGAVKLHTWRTGKHTKGKYQGPGQVTDDVLQQGLAVLENQ